jgi:hypothetical protein
MTSWAGYEVKRQRLVEAAMRARAADNAIGAKCSSLSLIADVCDAMNGRAAPEDVVALARAMGDVRALHRELVVENGLDFHLVRQAWADVLNPCKTERARTRPPWPPNKSQCNARVTKRRHGVQVWERVGNPTLGASFSIYL